MLSAQIHKIVFPSKSSSNVVFKSVIAFRYIPHLPPPHTHTPPPPPHTHTPHLPPHTPIRLYTHTHTHTPHTHTTHTHTHTHPPHTHTHTNRDNLSPPLLLHNTPTVTFNNVNFTNNHPEKLDNETAIHICYFSGGQRDVFFIDNRTTSGAISFYIEDLSTRFLIINSTFFNNSARPDDDVTIPRLSSAYGHGGAVNIRLLNSYSSRVCIANSIFSENYADAHAGGLAISLAGVSIANEFYIADSIFDGNYCKIGKCTGGAVGIDFFSNTRVNTILFSKTNFTRNKAESSGAISLSTFVSAQYEDGMSDSLRLDECIFEENEAFFEGTAFGAFSLTNANQIGVPIEVYNW